MATRGERRSQGSSHLSSQGCWAEDTGELRVMRADEFAEGLDCVLGANLRLSK